MSGYGDLGTTGQQKITEQLYKQLFGYPGGKYLQPFSAEIPGTSRINVFQNQLFSQEIPSTAPSVSEYGASFNLILINNNYSNTIPSLSKRYVSTTDPHIVYYKNIVLSSNELTQNQIYWFAGANRVYNSNDSSTQFKNNLLTKGIPPNYSPDGSYNATIYISNSEDDEGVAYTIGNAQYPWVYNPNSGIVQFLGNSEFTGSGIPSNNYPNASQIVRFTFWRYEGKIGNDDITATRISAGSITGTTGFIGGVTFNNNTVTATTISAGGITGASGFIGGVTFNNNTVTATTINASGITGASGFIGGVTLNGGAITATVGTFNTGVTAGAITSGAITASGSNSIGGVTLNNNNITANVGTFTGVTAGAINATSGATFGSDNNYVSILNGNIIATGGVTFLPGTTYAVSILNGAIKAPDNVTSTIGAVRLGYGHIRTNNLNIQQGATFSNKELESKPNGEQHIYISHGSINATSGATFGSGNKYVSILNGNITAVGAIGSDSGNISIIPCATSGYSNVIVQPGDAIIVGAGSSDGKVATVLTTWGSTASSGIRVGSTALQLGWGGTAATPTHALTFSKDGTVFNNGLTVWGKTDISGTATIGTGNTYVTISGGAITTKNGGSNSIGGVTLSGGAITATGDISTTNGIISSGNGSNSIGGVTLNNGAITATNIRVNIGATFGSVGNASYVGILNGAITASGIISSSNGSNSIGGVTLSGGAITADGSIKCVKTTGNGVNLQVGARNDGYTGCEIRMLHYGGQHFNISNSESKFRISNVSGYNGDVFIPTDATHVLTINRNHNVGIGTDTPTSKLHVDGAITSTGTITADSFNATSDYRVKENIESIETNKYNVDKLKPVVYTLKSSNQTGIGFIAHEIQEHYPFLVSGTKDGPETQSVNYIGLIAVLTKEVQQLKQENIRLKQRLEKIEFKLGL